LTAVLIDTRLPSMARRMSSFFAPGTSARTS
jgi:hypothetical protein